MVLLTYGEPENHSLLEHYRYSLSILRRLTLRIARIPRFLIPAIAMIRAWNRVREWRSHGVVSPLEAISRGQAAALAKALGEEYEVRTAFEFRPPGLIEVVTELRQNPPSRLLMLPLYTIDSDLTTGISKADLMWETLRRGDLPCPVSQVSRFSED